MSEIEPKIVELAPKRLIGLNLDMSRVADQTPQLWQSFMPRRHEVLSRVNSDVVSLQVYPQGPAQIADPNASFTKWALVEVEPDAEVPAGMYSFDLPGGLYAVFPHHGPANDLSTVMFIFTTWIPSSTYELDDRPHFEVLPQGYQPMDPQAREEFWIPVMP